MNELVAWMGKDYDGMKAEFYFDIERNKLPFRLYETAIPLYTHPVKELTDEEILEIANGCLVGATAWHNPELDPIEFAKAILRKAQEK